MLRGEELRFYGEPEHLTVLRGTVVEIERDAIIVRVANRLRRVPFCRVVGYARDWDKFLVRPGRLGGAIDAALDVLKRE